MTQRTEVRRGELWLGSARSGVAGLGVARRDSVRLGAAWLLVGFGAAWSGLVRLAQVGPGVAWHGREGT